MDEVTARSLVTNYRFALYDVKYYRAVALMVKAEDHLSRFNIEIKRRKALLCCGIGYENDDSVDGMLEYFSMEELTDVVDREIDGIKHARENQFIRSTGERIFMRFNTEINRRAGQAAPSYYG